ncbi:hypothetical protein [Aliivibrio fischeri]|uniref:hypothetical protein n=1 Tax=Aliivibrio fischeri TaxID=668 RepID=UPI0022A963D7|nr:hypothetical protein [Aliivibrio fischeri]
MDYELSTTNYSPVAMDDHTYGSVDKSVVLNVLKNGYDPDNNDTLLISYVSLYDATVEILPNGSIRLTE